MALQVHELASGSCLSRYSPSIHATNILYISPNRYLITWFGGTREKHPDTAIYGCFWDNGFSAPFKIAKVANVAHWNPILFSPDGGIRCYFKVGYDCASWRTWLTVSLDGMSWSRPSLMMPGDFAGRGPSKNKPIVLSNGSWLCPGSDESGKWRSFIDRSDDRGINWAISDEITHPICGIIQPTIWESAPGVVHMLMRGDGGVIVRSNSIDHGYTWSKPVLTNIPNNNSGIDLAKHNNELLLVYNPVAVNWGRRTPLSIVVSDDNGHSWYNRLNIENDEGEYSYPSIVINDGIVAITYTRFRLEVGFFLGSIKTTQSKILVHS